MQSELLLHAMLSKIIDSEELLVLKSSLIQFVKKSQLSGCFLLHENEIIHYISGTDEDMNGMLRIMGEFSCLSHIKTIHSGERNDTCLGMWNFVTSDPKYSSTDDEGIEMNMKDFLARLKLARNVSLGLQLFSSLAEILVSEKIHF